MLAIEPIMHRLEEDCGPPWDEDVADLPTTQVWLRTFDLIIRRQKSGLRAATMR